MRSWQKKPPKGRSYPVRPSVLEAAIAAAGITLPVELARVDGSKEAAFLGDYCPRGSFPDGELFRLSCQSVPSDRVAEVRSAFEAAAVPQFVEWAKRIEALDYHSPVRREYQQFKWAYPDAKR